MCIRDSSGTGGRLAEEAGPGTGGAARMCRRGGECHAERAGERLGRADRAAGRSGEDRVDRREHMTLRSNQHPSEIVVDERSVSPVENPRILVTNDDGIDSPGLKKLASRLARDFEVVVVAPADDMSGTGTALGRFDPKAGVELTQTTVDGISEAYTVDGPPGLAVLAASLGAFGDPPDLVVSGINAGLNTGHSIIHSG